MANDKCGIVLPLIVKQVYVYRTQNLLIQARRLKIDSKGPADVLQYHKHPAHSTSVGVYVHFLCSFWSGGGYSGAPVDLICSVIRGTILLFSFPSEIG